tara:strand:- start:304 stop:534 length:231 start_codon:yes stop_codon:yes gene_type:complete
MTESKQKITKDTIIGDVLRAGPEAVEVLMDTGVHCIGCGAAQFESLHDGLAMHGMSEEDIEKIVEKLNKAVEESEN